ncbi:MAG TPA: rhodanese-like domain-containing protein [Candidatus Thermoplasmatota archaeon]
MAPNQVQIRSHVLSTPPAPPQMAADHFARRLELETDAWDLHEDLTNKVNGIVVLDARQSDSFAAEHIPGAINLHHAKITADTTATWSKTATYVVYCAGVNCNASTKGCAKLADLGFNVKELLDGLEGWKKEGYPVETGTSPIPVKRRA